jgi:hypothetical protein
MVISGIVMAGGFSSSATSDKPAVLQTADSCSICHSKLSELVPQTHFKATLNEVKNCLGCHSVPGAATAFAWTTHETHYSKLGSAAQCMLCHEIDATGDFNLIGVDDGKEMKTTMETVTKMEPYYLSWATSPFLDRKHGQQSVTCATCHDEAFPQTFVKKEKCFTCHGSYEQVSRLAPIHYDAMMPHFGNGQPIECNECHKAHQKSVMACNECHNFRDPVP